MMTAPVLPQHMVALSLANHVRRQRHDLKHDVTTGEKTAADVILAPPEFALTMAVLDVLTAQHRWGLQRGRKLLRVVQVRDGKLLGELTDRQRRMLADLLTWGAS